MAITLLDVVKPRREKTPYENALMEDFISRAGMSPRDALGHEFMLRQQKHEAMRIEEEMETHIQTTCPNCATTATLVIDDTAVANSFVQRANPYRIIHHGKVWEFVLPELRSLGFDQETGAFDAVMENICKFNPTPDTEALRAYFK